MPITVWANHELRPGARELFLDSLSRLGCRLIQSEKSSRSVLAEGEPDPTLAEADVAYGQPAPADILASPRLRWVALSTAGYTRYDNAAFRDAMKARNLSVTNVSAVFAHPCAEHVLAMMLGLARELPKYVRNELGPRGWPYLEGRYTIEMLEGKTVILLGYGAIAVRLAQLLAPFRCRIIGVRRKPRGDEGIEIVPEPELAGVLPYADHVVNILPESPETRKRCDAGFFAAMRRGAFFYNIGRGGTVDQDALVGALYSGQVGGAYLDALDPEPLPPEHPLWAAPNCHITPHVGGGHKEQDENLVRHFTQNLGRFIAKKPLVDRIF